MIFAAAIGLSGIVVPDLVPLLGRRLRALGERTASKRPTAYLAAVSVVVAAVAIAFAPAIGPLDRATRVTIASARHLARTADRSLPRIRTALAGGAVGGSGSSTLAGGAGSPAELVVVPVPIRPRVAVELDRSLDQVGSYRDATTWAASAPRPGQLILIDVDPSASSAATAAFRLSVPGTVAGVRLVPLLSDPADGTWLLQVAAP
jgi:hypothetical protein